MWRVHQNLMHSLSDESRRDRERIASLRPSPDVAGMYRHRDPDGTIWAFSKKRQLSSFLKHRKSEETKNYLSPRELLTQSLYGIVS